MHHRPKLVHVLLASAALLVIAASVGCEGSRDPILGWDGGAAQRPTVTTSLPADQATGVTVTNPVISVTFSEPMAPFTGAATFTVGPPSPGATVPGTSALDASGSTATFTVAVGTTLAPYTVYTVTVTGARSLATGLALAAPYVTHFTTGAPVSTIRPQVTLTVPGAVLNAPTNTAVTATFTEAMAPGTFTQTSFTLAAGSAVLGAVSYDAGSLTASFKPTADLLPATTYTATLTVAVTDLAGNALAGNQAPLPAASNYVWTFTTAAGPDLLAPTITSTLPADLAAGVPLNTRVNATFSKAMAFATVTFTVGHGAALLNGAATYDPLTRIATFTPAANLLPNTSYTATISGAKDLAGNALAPGLAPNPWTFTTGAALQAGAIALGASGTFGIMATSAITNTGNTIINGDVALAPGTSVSGFPPGIINGALHLNDSVAAQAQLDLLAAYNTATNLPPGTTITAGADLGALYPLGLPPGTYTSGSTMLVSTPLVLDAGGDTNAVWVFQIGSSLTTTANVSLANGAQAKNVFWVAVLDATVGVGSSFSGTIVSGRNVSAVTGAVINGRILAGATTAGTIALQSNVVTVPLN